MTKTTSRRYKGNGGRTLTFNVNSGSAGAILLMGIVVSALIFFVYWLFAWNNSITQIVLINGIDMAQLTWINVLIDPVAQGAAYLYAPSLFFWTTGVFAIIVFVCFLIPALASK